jgi:hypothetical protein
MFVLKNFVLGVQRSGIVGIQPPELETRGDGRGTAEDVV